MTARFAECFQFHKVYNGTAEQHAAVIDSLTPIFGDNQHQLLKRLDHQVNSGVAVDGTVYHPRSALTVEFHKGMTAPGHASPAGFSLSSAMGYAGCFEVARHEGLGHMADFWLLTEADREWFRTYMGRETWAGSYEAFAEAVREWSLGGWKALTPILLPNALAPSLPFD